MPGLRLFVNLMAEVSALPFEKHGPQVSPAPNPDSTILSPRSSWPSCAFHPAVQGWICGSVAVLIQVNRYFLHWNV